MKSCPKSKNLVLYFYDELPQHERPDMEAHVKACPACQGELSALQQLQTATPKPQVEDGVLLPTRRALFYKLRRSQSSLKKPGWSIGAPALRAGLAIVLVGFGFLLGRVNTPDVHSTALNDLLTAAKTISVAGGSISPYLLGIDDVSVNPADGTIEISYNTVNDIRIRGDVDDPAVQQMLLYALLTNDPAVRLRALRAVRQVASATHSLDDACLDALEQVLIVEDNIGVKLAVLKALKAANNSPQSREILIRAMLADKNKAVRIQAFKSLVHGKSGTFKLHDILSTTKTDSNVYIRTKSLELLQTLKERSL